MKNFDNFFLVCSSPHANDVASFQNARKFLFDGDELQNRIIKRAEEVIQKFAKT